MIIEGRTVNCHDIYRIHIAGNYNLKKLEFMNGSLLFKKRSPKRALGKFKTDNLCFSEIVSIEKVYNKTMYDIQVENTNSFYTSYGILIHNCGIQYARENSDLSMPVDMRMCHWTELKDMVNLQKCYDGSDCVRCYYNNYNELLNLLTSDIKHRNFL